MPRFRFRGFPTSSAVALSLSQGAAAENSSVMSWGTQSPTSLDVSATFTESDDNGAVISPGAVWLTVTGWSGWDTQGPSGTEYDPRLHDIEYYWTITGPGDFAVRSEVNLPSSPAAFRDMSIQRGPKVVFPLSAAGSYTWTCFAVEPASGKILTKQGTIMTVSEDEAFPGARTICYSIDANFTGAPSGAVLVDKLTDMRAAITTAISNALTFRICLRRGETYAGSNIAFTSQWTVNFLNFRSSTYGTGADPVVEAPFSTDDGAIGAFFHFPSGGGSKHVWYGPIHWKGRWDTVNERGVPDKGALWGSRNAAGTVTGYGVRCTGLMIPLNLPGQNNSYAAFINCDLSDWKNWGVLEGNKATNPTLDINRNIALIGTRLACIANCVEQYYGRTEATWDPRLCNGAAGGGGWLIRAIPYSALIMQHCSFNSRWGVEAASPAAQKYFRLNNQNTSNDINACSGMWVNVSYCVHEGMAAGGMYDLAGQIYYNAIIDGNIFIPAGLAGSNEKLIAGGGLEGGVTVRNNYVYSGYDAAVKTNGTVLMNGLDPKPGPVNIYNNTSYNARNTSTNYTRDINNFVDSTVENNLFRRFGADTGFDVTEQIAGLSLNFIGLKPGFPIIPVELAGMWADGATFEIPYTNALLNEQNGNQTSQAYWQGLPGTDNQHAINTGSTEIYALAGDFSVSFSSTGVVFTNNTGSGIGGNGAALNIKLDRASQLAAPDTRYAANAVGPIVWCKIADASKGSFEAATGLISDRDLFGVRRESPAYRGAVEV